MGEKKQRKKKKKRKQTIVSKQETVENQGFLKLLEVLDKLEKEEKYMDVKICPHCKSPRVRRVHSKNGDMSGHLGMLPVKFECLDCGRQERLVIEATNRKLGVKEVAIITEASNLKE